jgi:hypothetical protein
MLIAALGGLIGITKHNKDNSSSYMFRAFLVIAFGVFLMVAVDLVLMFTLPFSDGQYFNFNPEPFAAMFAASIFIPFAMSLSLVLVSSSAKIPYFFSCVTAVIIVIQSTSTITSNSYFSGLFPFYILNIMPAIVADLFLLKMHDRHQNRKKEITFRSEKRYLFASMLLSSFFITLFFPWSVDVYGGFFKPSEETRTEEFLLQILFPTILPVFIPISLFSSFIAGTLAIHRLKKKPLNAIP